jgi:Protein of unknown function (DUF732)
MLRKILIGITIPVVLLTSNPARANTFENFLQGILTPEEVEIHKKIGNQRAIQLARQACNALDSGMSVEDFATQVSQSLVREGLPQAQLQARALYSGKVIAAGVANFCPQHMSELLQLQQ